MFWHFCLFPLKPQCIGFYACMSLITSVAQYTLPVITFNSLLRWETELYNKHH